MSRRLLVPLIALLATIAGLLSCGAWNRGEARQRLTLTERELGRPWHWQNAGGDEGVLRVPIEWQRRDTPLDERTWLTDDHLRDIGFDLSMPVGSPDAPRFYQRTLPRLAWVVLEYDGPAWQEIDRRRRLRTADDTVRSPLPASRLVPVDGGPEYDALARRYANTRTLILPAVFQVVYLADEKAGGPLLYGHVMSLVVPEVTVPRRLRSPLLERRDQTPTAADTPPRVHVDVAVGRLGFPWVTDVRTLR